MNLSKKSFLRPIFLSFTCFYLLSMLLCTYLKTAEFKKTYAQNIGLQLEHTASQIYTSASLNNCNGETLSDNQLRQLKYYLSNIVKEDSYNPVSMALYDSNGNLVAQSTNLLTANTPYPMTISSDQPLNHHYDLNNYLTVTELEEFANFCSYCEIVDLENEDYEKGVINSRITAKVNADNWELSKLYIYRVTSTTNIIDAANYVSEEIILDKELVWTWTNPSEVPESEIIILENERMSALLPYSDINLNIWQDWNNNTHLHNYPDHIQGGYDDLCSLSLSYEDSLWYTSIYPVIFAGDTNQENIYMLVYRSEDHSLIAALDYMKYIYICGFIIALLCMLFVWYAMEKVMKKQRLLEENRRDFTNAIAHELKTPLGVIRGFSENLKENVMEEKKDYYLEQIIGQTEEMNQMVQEMIYISKLDSDQLTLHTEPISLRSLLEAQFDKLESLMQEKNLPYVFDMFYTGDSSRSSQEKHLGLGLYLARKIFNLHHLHITIENIEDRVQVSVHI